MFVFAGMATTPREYLSLTGVNLSSYAAGAASPGIDVKTYPGAPEYLRDLAAGRLDAALNDRLMLAYLLKNSQLPLRTGSNVGPPPWSCPMSVNTNEPDCSSSEPYSRG